MNIYGIRVANQMGWSKVIKQSEEAGGSIITSNGKVVAMVVSIAEFNIDGDFITQNIDDIPNNASKFFFKHYYGYFITRVVGKLLKSFILGIKNDKVKERIEMRDFFSYNLNLTNNIYKNVSQEVMDEMELTDRPMV